ncbi:HK97 family phage prohead protease [Novosphingobium sp. FGD1]|uniref:HK97 family phage prohead protease n=1 Tax=Novosphingobium silvae TaxID=2692619 RepID=A0A7X4GIW6_9SPHN|nr:HK97 family phage prohead protease [Novosphingobium silvae]MYL98414.1 HK97 family phage prohead protease [Novosphingobium silvae]
MTITTETRNFTLTNVEVRAKTDDAEGRAQGYAAVFDSDSHDLGGFVERISPGAFKGSLAAAAAGETNIYALWAHRDDSPLGSTGSGKLVLREDAHGLAFDLDTTRFTPAQLDALRDGDLRMSFGFRVIQQQWREDDTGRVERTLLDVDLIEISFVISPAYPSTEAALRSLEVWRSDRTDENKDDIRVTLFKRALSKRFHH